MFIQRQPLSQLRDQLDKLEALMKILPLNIQFIYGYVFGHLPNNFKLHSGQIKRFTEVIKNLFQLSRQKIIHQINFLQIIVFICFELFKQTQFKNSGFKMILQQIEIIVNNLAMNQWYLRQRYFLPKVNPNGQNFISEKNPSNYKILSFGKSNINEPSLEKEIKKQEIIKSDPMKEIKMQKKQSLKMKLEQGNLGIECPICAIQISHEDVSVLNCGHILHKNCLQQYLKQVITNKRFPIKCPFGDCEKNMDTRDIEQYLSKPLLEKYYQFSFHTFVQKNHKGVSWCPTAGCPSVFQFDQDLINYRCPNCKKNYCLKCKCEMHTGISCQLYKNLNGLSEEDKQFVDFARGLNFKQCPSCKFWVQKNQGCNHMTCRCQYQFCYVCGAEYGTCSCQQDDDDNDRSYYDEQQQSWSQAGVQDLYRQEV